MITTQLSTSGRKTFLEFAMPPRPGMSLCKTSLIRPFPLLVQFLGLRRPGQNAMHYFEPILSILDISKFQASHPTLASYIRYLPVTLCVGFIYPMYNICVSFLQNFQGTSTAIHTYISPTAVVDYSTCSSLYAHKHKKRRNNNY